MSDAWMDEYTYQIVVHKDLLTDEQKSLGTSANCFGTLGSNGRISIKEEGPAVRLYVGRRTSRISPNVV